MGGESSDRGRKSHRRTVAGGAAPGRAVSEYRGQTVHESVGVRLRVYQSYLEIAPFEEGGDIAIRVTFEELGRVEAEVVLGISALVIEDRWGLLVAAVRMDPFEATRVQSLIEELRATPDP